MFLAPRVWYAARNLRQSIAAAAGSLRGNSWFSFAPMAGRKAVLESA